MSNIMHCDIAIIGAGAGGLSVAAVAAQLNLNVVLIEDGKMGGDCLNAGCVPSKAFIAAAKSAHGFLSSGRYGIQPANPDIQIASIMDRVADVIRTLSAHDSVERFTEMGVHVIQAHGEFIDDRTVKAGDNLIRARRFVIATGSSPAIPPIPGIENVTYFTNETIFGLREKPGHLIVIGGGPIGCELAQAFAHLGTSVTLLEAFSIMPKDDVTLVEILRQQFNRDGITIHEHIKILNIATHDDHIEVTITRGDIQETIKGTHLLVAAGRKPSIQGLGLDKAKVTVTPKGIQTSNKLRTSNRRIYAIGDVIGGYQFTHIANYHAGIVIRNIIFKLPAKVDYRALPWVTYTSPELSHTGMSLEEATIHDKTARTISVPFTANDRAQTERTTIGQLNVVVTAKGKILGCSILGPQAGELILPWVMLIKDGKSLRDLTDVTIPYPTLNEISKRAASAFYAPALFSGKVRWLVNLLKYLG